DFGSGEGDLSGEQAGRKPTTRRYAPEEKPCAVRMMRTSQMTFRTEHGTVRTWADRADLDEGVSADVMSVETVRLRLLEHENPVVPGLITADLEWGQPAELTEHLG
ncbi:MAG: hypothetical protein LH624_08060, partial [Cryobacterium sp.]|nr:hypothetical protein [Cryobacterium sp.]